MSHHTSSRTPSGQLDQLPDRDPEETAEWIESLDAVVRAGGPGRARLLLARLLEHGAHRGLGLPPVTRTPYVNTVPTAAEPSYPGDPDLEERITAYNRWNAAAMVTRASRYGLGGHMATYASAAWLYEVGFQHFFRGRADGGSGDQIYFQGHASPGVYARAFLEGRLTVDQLDRFRREVGGGGLPSYPHPRSLGGFWEFPTVSMGLGPLAAVYQARFNRYLHNRGLEDTSGSRVWAFLGDGEMDEPEATAALTLAAREGLDNLVFVINCNLQRLDGPVRGNGRVVQELESVFAGAGWHVVKALWGRDWDELFARDHDGELIRRLEHTPDGQFQTYSAADGGYIRDNLLGGDPDLRGVAAHLDDARLAELIGFSRAGHEPRKVYAAYRAAIEHRGGPSVVLVQTVKGWTLGPGFEARNANHQMKKLRRDEFREMRDRLDLPVADADLDGELPPYLHPGPDSREARYLADRRRALGGPVPARRVAFTPLPEPPALTEAPFAALLKGAGKQEIATTMAFVRLARELMRDPVVGRSWVPIVPDEARTFGMESMFPTAGIYSPHGQTYDAVDRELLLSYREAVDGQILNEGITEAGAVASFTAAATAYATHGRPMIPFYVFYSMFGWQRVADQLWALADQMGRGFLIGATAGRTTMTGEGLQHADGHSQLIASTNPACVSYDPAFAYEIAVIVRDGLRRMLTATPGHPSGEDVFYYLTVYNEPLPQPPMPSPDAAEGILRGIHRCAPVLDVGAGTGIGAGVGGAARAGADVSAGADTGAGADAELLASGTAVRWALEAQRLLAEEWGVSAQVWSVTSWTELRREALAAGEDQVPYIVRVLAEATGPVVAVSDWMRAVPDQIAPWVRQDWTSLGTDGFGLSDTRAATRTHFAVDAPSIAIRTLSALARQGKAKPEVVREAMERYGRTEG
ncbi:pyruvate dehydrogenase (acetyl-transferring), homodimeric type [Embleya sp. NBC_00888]|uniref:pyruvate dehydrogenase (acetyl-transferring), homodimeric type n=1 Tax=Embleya sp. NBC_00888 TaxID=2975960 RepID=UPI00386FF90A|nr:pyruvate dehydrogenase (acetyl-transferring), homodimeric type [Embleya sp. NBC_00888]